MWQYHLAEARTERVDNREGKLRRPIYPLGGGGGIATMLPSIHPITYATDGSAVSIPDGSDNSERPREAAN
ncbi:hypothetical protein GP486_002468 [Trichoglossum hirsutum]|uniref:Uncharacterized protein n=1 Tax=Trichoglossum hirsutum TaxID=265104 RepID=A0A9P8LEW3_9PEZI|nr:hypothetical protein GP486_002468 [Trichoglossum hirsutum]